MEERIGEREKKKFVEGITLGVAGFSFALQCFHCGNVQHNNYYGSIRAQFLLKLRASLGGI